MIDDKSPPDFVKNIKKPNSNIPFDMDFYYYPQNPYTINTDATSLGKSSIFQNEEIKPSFSETFKAEFKEFNNPAKFIHSGMTHLANIDPKNDPRPPGWTPTSNEEMFLNVRPEYIKSLTEASGPRAQQRLYNQILQEQHHDDALANGSVFARLLGGLSGAVTDPLSYVPIVGWAKYAKFAPTFLQSALRAAPGMATYGVINAAGNQLDKVNGNLEDFAKDAFVSTVFGTVLFGGIGTASLAADKLELWNLRNLAKDHIDGIDYRLHLNDLGKVVGIKAVDTTGNLSAARMNYAQELADSSFHKSGIFKVPYLGEAVKKFISLPVLGSPQIDLFNSPYQTMRGLIDRVASHSFITKGLAEGKTAPQNFTNLMNQEFSGLRALQTQVDALHLERNGFDIKSRPLQQVTGLYQEWKNKTLKSLSDDLSKNNWVSKEDFYSEVENVLINKQASEHSSVNEAASMFREKIDNTYKAWRKAYNLPEDWLPPKTAEGYLMRVYNTPYLNGKEGQWISVVSNWLKEADETISQHMEPIETLSEHIKDFESKHTQAVRILGNLEAKRGKAEAPKQKAIEEGKEKTAETNEIKVGSPEYTLQGMRRKLRTMKDNLENELRSNPDLQLHVHDWNALSANESKELIQLLAPIRVLEKEIAAQKEIVRKTKAQQSGKLSRAKTSSTIEKAIPKSKKFLKSEVLTKAEQNKLDELQRKLDLENERLQDLAHKGDINPRFYTKDKDSFNYVFKDPEDRLRFRDRYESKEAREGHAKAYYDTIMNQTPEQTIAQTMGKVTGVQSENSLKSRTLLLPDKILYDNNFMTKDLMSKTSNYVSYLARRTHLKNIFADVTHDGGIEPLILSINEEYDGFRAPLNAKIDELGSKEQTPTIKKQIAGLEKKLDEERKKFNKVKDQLSHVYKKMMGIQDATRAQIEARSAIMSFTAMANLPFVPFTMVSDLANIGLQHGMWPFIRDGIYPMIESFAGMRKTADSEGFRNAAASIHLALSDVLNGYADRNWSMQTNPYLNLGKISSNLQTLAHLNSNFTLTNYLDNGLQRIAASVTQSELMRCLHAFKIGKISDKDSLYLRKYGIDPKKWADRMVSAYKEGGGSKTKLGGHNSRFWQWQDLEAANKFGDAVYRGTQDAIISRGIVDSPFWTDHFLGSIVNGFAGWTFASVNRYVIPSLQQPDANKLAGVMMSLALGALVDPMRRMARGEPPTPENQTKTQFMYAAFQNSGYFSFFSTALAQANLLSGDNLLGNLKSDKYKDRTRSGMLGPAWGTANRILDVVSALSSGEMNEADAKKMVRMLPFANASWTWMMSKTLIEHLGLPKTRAEAHARK